MRYAVIMAGGSGTRLWPMSTAEQPKQLIPFMKGKSLLQLAVERLQGVVDFQRILICTGEAFREPIKQAMPQFTDAQILGEPTGRDTLNAVGFPAAVAMKDDPEAVVAVFTADHLIEPVESFAQRVEVGFSIAEKDPNRLVTFGIRPSYAATGYGYVQLGETLADDDASHTVQEFKEKPDEPTARKYLERGNYLWNSGMFVWRASTLMDCIRRYKPENYEGLMKIGEAWATDQQKTVLDQVYPNLEKISVDYAVMEPASNDDQVQLVCVEMSLRWLDVGSWPAYAKTCESDDSDNCFAAGKYLTMDSSNTLVVSEDDEHLVATLGVKDLVVVHTGKVTLICHRDAAERIKELHKAVGEVHGAEYL